jgi:hypothetical protein
MGNTSPEENPSIEHFTSLHKLRGAALSLVALYLPVYPTFIRGIVKSPATGKADAAEQRLTSKLAPPPSQSQVREYRTLGKEDWAGYHWRPEPLDKPYFPHHIRYVSTLLNYEPL